METRCTQKELQEAGIVNTMIRATLPWNIQLNRYCSAISGERWRLGYDDDFIADFDHAPNMGECMNALILWWNPK